MLLQSQIVGGPFKTFAQQVRPEIAEQLTEAYIYQKLILLELKKNMMN